MTTPGSGAARPQRCAPHMLLPDSVDPREMERPGCASTGLLRRQDRSVRVSGSGLGTKFRGGPSTHRDPLESNPSSSRPPRASPPGPAGSHLRSAGFRTRSPSPLQQRRGPGRSPHPEEPRGGCSTGRAAPHPSPGARRGQLPVILRIQSPARAQGTPTPQDRDDPARAAKLPELWLGHCDRIPPFAKDSGARGGSDDVKVAARRRSTTVTNVSRTGPDREAARAHR